MGSNFVSILDMLSNRIYWLSRWDNALGVKHFHKFSIVLQFF
jgi:hypothetical protein